MLALTWHYLESAEMAKKALVIAIRYAVVRKQFSSVKNGPENQIMDYKTHQFKLIPLLAYTYAMELLARKVRVEYDKLLEKINVKNLSNDQMASLVETMKELHSSSASGKAIVSWKTLETIEQCRQSCGGMGYLAYANLSALYQDHVVHCTWEGDNTVLTLQTGRYLVSAVREAAHGKKLPEGVGHLNKLPGILKQTYRSSNVADLEVIQEALDVTCANLAARAAKLVEENLSKGMELPQALEKACTL